MCMYIYIYVYIYIRIHTYIHMLWRFLLGTHMIANCLAPVSVPSREAYGKAG